MRLQLCASAINTIAFPHVAARRLHTSILHTCVPLTPVFDSAWASALRLRPQRQRLIKTVHTRASTTTTSHCAGGAGAREPGANARARSLLFATIDMIIHSFHPRLALPERRNGWRASRRGVCLFVLNVFPTSPAQDPRKSLGPDNKHKYTPAYIRRSFAYTPADISLRKLHFPFMFCTRARARTHARAYF